MADEHDKWLNRETAERLLRGESLEAVDAAARDQAERLAEALGALSAQAAPATAELPGEQSALAAFRKAREAAEAERTAAALGDGTPGGRSGAFARGADAGLVRIGAGGRTGIRSRRPRWARPVRLALAAVVAAATLGGVAMAAGGVLPVPFHDERPAPAASVSADHTPARPLTSPSAPAPEGLAPGAGTPGTGGTPGGGPSGHAPGTGPDATPGAPAGTPGAWWQEAGAACRDIRDGRELGAGRRRALEGLAGGPARVTAYCKSVLAGRYTGGGQNGNGGGNGTGGQDDGGGKSTGNGNGTGGQGKGKGKGNGQGGDDDSHRGLGEGKGHGRDGGHGGDRGHGSGGHRPNGVASSGPTRLAPPARGRGASAPMPSPSPSYTTL